MKYVTKSEESKPAHAMNLVVLGMAKHQLQQPNASRRALEEASTVIDRLQAERVVWEFTRSNVSGEIGATKSLLEKLKKLGIDVIIND